MIKRRAYIIEVNGPKVKVGFKRHSMCGNCGGCRIDDHTFELESDCDVVPGQEVTLATDSRWFILSALFCFVVPSLLFIVVMYSGRNRIMPGTVIALAVLAGYFMVYKKFFLEYFEDKIKTRIIDLCDPE